MKRVFIAIFIVLVLICSLLGCNNKSGITSRVTETLRMTNDVITDKTIETTKYETSISTNEASSEDLIDSELILDKTYHNDRFGFEFKYPGKWSLVEQSKNNTDPDHGAVVFINDSSVSPTPIVNLDRTKDLILVYGQVSTPAISGEPTGEFTTNDGVKGTMYYEETEGKMLTYIVFINENSGHGYGYGAIINVSKEVNEKYGDVITEILKSIKLP